MVKSFLLTVLVLYVACRNYETPSEERLTIHSVSTNDDYIIGFRFPSGYKEADSCKIIYVADGTLGLGQYVIGTDSSWKANIPANCIIVTIGHTGDWEEKRRRDFIPSESGGLKEKLFGNADRFYAFLKTELKPLIDKKFPRAKKNYFIGHSFSGLFCLYAALKNDALFDGYFAISPSVWANDRELMKLEKTFALSHHDLAADIHIYAGGLEVLNKVLFSSKEFYSRLLERKYPHTHISFEVIRFANHFSIRKPAIDKILTQIGG